MTLTGANGRQEHIPPDGLLVWDGYAWIPSTPTGPPLQALGSEPCATSVVSTKAQDPGTRFEHSSVGVTVRNAAVACASRSRDSVAPCSASWFGIIEARQAAPGLF
jgi:hypothetical protein